MTALLRELPALPAPGKALTARERAMLYLIAEGLTNAEIGRRLYVTVDTVKTRVYRIAVKLQARNRTHIVHRAWQTGVLAHEGDSQ